MEPTKFYMNADHQFAVEEADSLEKREPPTDQGQQFYDDNPHQGITKEDREALSKLAREGATIIHYTPEYPRFYCLIDQDGDPIGNSFSSKEAAQVRLDLMGGEASRYRIAEVIIKPL